MFKQQHGYMLQFYWLDDALYTDPKNVSFPQTIQHSTEHNPELGKCTVKDECAKMRKKRPGSLKFN